MLFCLIMAFEKNWLIFYYIYSIIMQEARIAYESLISSDILLLEFDTIVWYNKLLNKHIYGVKMKSVNRYQLRHAAGKYWLLDMQQDGLEYRKPVMLNECAALIWECSSRGETQEQIVKELQKAYGIPEEQAREDTEQFIRRLREQGLI